MVAATTTQQTTPEPKTGAPGRGVDGLWRTVPSLPTFVYWGIHAACLAIFWTGWSAGSLALLAVTFYVRMFAITGGYHRYFSHRTYRTSRSFQFVLALLGASATQKGPLWWAGNHRHHHANADTEGDVHSPRDGLYWAHQGWVASERWEPTLADRVPDLSRYPELVWLNRWHFVPSLALALLCFAVGGFGGLVWGFFVSTTLLWHATYTINSLAHTWGTRRYDTPDTSRNNALLALLTMGEGWHNNHHHYMACARQGFYWWEVDVTYYVLRALAAIGLVWDVREPPAHVLDAGRRARDAQAPTVG